MLHVDSIIPLLQIVITKSCKCGKVIKKSNENITLFSPRCRPNQAKWRIEKAKREIKEDVLLLFDGVLEAISLVSCGQFK